MNGQTLSQILPSEEKATTTCLTASPRCSTKYQDKKMI